MLAVLALIAPMTVTPTVSPQCQYYRYLSAAVWSALDDAERNGASKLVTNNLETTLRDTVQRERRACK